MHILFTFCTALRQKKSAIDKGSLDARNVIADRVVPLMILGDIFWVGQTWGNPYATHYAERILNKIAETKKELYRIKAQQNIFALEVPP